MPSTPALLLFKTSGRIPHKEWALQATQALVLGQRDRWVMAIWNVLVSGICIADFLTSFSSLLICFLLEPSFCSLFPLLYFFFFFHRSYHLAYYVFISSFGVFSVFSLWNISCYIIDASNNNWCIKRPDWCCEMFQWMYLRTWTMQRKITNSCGLVIP